MSALAFGCFAAACGKKEEPPPPPPTPTVSPTSTTVTAPAPVPPAPVVATQDANGVVQLTAGDEMRFSATRIEVKAGAKVKLELTNKGVQPKIAMGHNL